MSFDFYHSKRGDVTFYIIIMTSSKCEKCQKYLHPVKKNLPAFQPFCLWCLNFLSKEDPEGLIMHVFHCVNHPLKRSQKKMSALDWGQMRCHCSIYQKLQDHLDGKSPYPFFGCDAAVQTAEESFEEVNVKAPEPILIQPIVTEPSLELSTLKMKLEDGEFEVRVGQNGKCTTCFNGFECELY